MQATSVQFVSKISFLLTILFPNFIHAMDLEPDKMVPLEKRVGGCGPVNDLEKLNTLEGDLDSESEILCWQGIEIECVTQDVAIDNGVDLERIHPKLIKVCNDI